MSHGMARIGLGRLGLVLVAFWTLDVEGSVEEAKK